MLGLIDPGEMIIYMTNDFAITTKDGRFIVYSPLSIMTIDREIFERAIKILEIEEYEYREVIYERQVG